jgi:hypothetical protein
MSLEMDGNHPYYAHRMGMEAGKLFEMMGAERYAALAMLLPPEETMPYRDWAWAFVRMRAYLLQHWGEEVKPEALAQLAVAGGDDPSFHNQG